MSQSSSLATPAAILLGSVIIGAGLYFGLHDRRPADAPAPSANPAIAGVDTMSARPATPPSPAPLPQPQGVAGPALGFGMAPPRLSPEVQARVNADAAAALAALKPELVSACWEPALKKAPTPKTSKYLFNSSFDPEGREVARGISEIRGESRADVAMCLRTQPMKLRIPAPGAIALVESAITFP